MAIDKYYKLTIKRSFDRQWSSLGSAMAMNVPYEKVKFIVGYDVKDFDDDMEAIAEAASADGFPNVKLFSGSTISEAAQQSAGGCMLMWNWGRMLRHIINTGETAIITWDDRCLNVDFNIVDDIVSELQGREEEFYILQLRLREYGDLQKSAPNHKVPAKGYDKKITDEQVIKETDYFDHNINKEHKSYFDTFLLNDLLGYDESMILSPKGAAWLLYQMLELKDNAPFRAKLNSDNWLVWGIRDAVCKATAKGKGLYCPKKKGYSFIREIMPMRTLTDWAAKNTWGYDHSQENTEPTFIDENQI